MLAVQEYLDLKDWHFLLDIDRGESHGYFYLESRALSIVDMVKALPKPLSPFRVLATSFDSHESAAMYENTQGWSSACQYALSDASEDYPSLNTSADCGFLVLDREFTQDTFNRAMTDFDDDALFSLLGAGASDADAFWRALELLEPFACFFLSDRLLLLTREKSSIDTFLATKEVQMVEDLHKKSERRSRLKLWQELGPECGPEVCVEEGCERLRIALAVKCFLHQVVDSEDAMKR